MRHSAGDIARQHGGNAGHHHPAAHHQALQAGGGQLADHGVADGGDQQLAKALQHIADGDPLEGDQPVGPRQMDTDRQHQHPQSHAEQGGGKLGGDVDIPPLFAQSLEQQRHQGAADDDDEGVDVLDPLGCDPQPEHVEVDVVLGEEHQPHGRQLVERPEDEGTKGEDQVSHHAATFGGVRVTGGHHAEQHQHHGPQDQHEAAAKAGMGQQQTQGGHQHGQNGEAGQHAAVETAPLDMAQRGADIRQNRPAGESSDDGDDVAQRRKQEQGAVILGELEVASHREADKEAQIHPGVVPQEGTLAAVIIRGEALGQHHVEAGDVEAAAGEEHGESPVEAGDPHLGDEVAADHLQHHPHHEQVAVAEVAPAEIAAKQVQAIVEGPEDPHHGVGLGFTEAEPLGGVEHQGGVEHGKPQG
ncbi:hypothetical protein AERO8C_80108 [Aeromonas veronii]|uniref:Uncharacterized protein n=1 Tax=Aeromonas veronii TaxID=654 RepID=A0A653LCQ5_AERVE|nr:hypothetical protein AERO8C_80108 [Aeromonas veronii]